MPTLPKFHETRSICNSSVRETDKLVKHKSKPNRNSLAETTIVGV